MKDTKNNFPLEFKELHPNDYDKAIRFAIDGMNFNRYMQSPTLLYLYGKYFLYLELLRATHILAAYHKDELVGLLIADMINREKKDHSLGKRIYVGLIDGIMKLVLKKQTLSYDETNALMLREYKKKSAPDGEICFLAADPNFQGKGIGSALINELGRLEQNKLFYLFTDNNCNYVFYEKRGFEKVGSQDIHMDLNQKRVPLTCLLYSMRF